VSIEAVALQRVVRLQAMPWSNDQNSESRSQEDRFIRLGGVHFFFVGGAFDGGTFAGVANSITV
jgi:hypothetical protein